MNPFSDQLEFSGRTFKNLSLSGVEIDGREFDGCTFSRCDLHSARLAACRLRDCTFSDCELNAITLPGCTLSEVAFEDCRLVGINWTDTAWAKGRFLVPARFTRCALNHSLFIALDMHEVVLKDCLAREADFSDANLSKAICSGTDFHDARFWHTDLTDADFTGAANYSIAASLNTLKRTKFSLPEAMSLLYSLDIILDDGR